MNVKVANTTDDFMGIRKIWEERFTTSQTYLDTIFSEVFPHCRSYISILCNKVVSVISLMPMKFFSPALDLPLKGFYLFGVATSASFEGKKLAAGLIEHASNQLASEGYDFIFERPANQGLNNYYLKLGFSKSIGRQQYCFNIEKHSSSTENIHRIQEIKSLSEDILKEIRIEFDTRFEWEDTKILEGLIALGELEENNKNCRISTVKDETYVAIKNLSQIDSNIYNNCFFCFPME